MNFLMFFHKFWKLFSFKSKNPHNYKCYAHPAPSPWISTERDRRALRSRRPHPSVRPSRGEADRRDLTDGEVSGQAKVTSYSPPYGGIAEFRFVKNG
jgi:hypothetical protein